MVNSLVEKAVRIVVEAHSAQKRKADGSPYIVHLIMVALKLAKSGFSDTVIAAGLTHDILEDTSFSPEKLREQLGPEVFDIVKTVTNDKSLVWEQKKQKYIDSVRNGSEEAKAVALADKIHNLESLIDAYNDVGPAVWKNFNRGKDKKIWFEEEVLKMLKETWDHPMIQEYEELIQKEKTLQ